MRRSTIVAFVIALLAGASLPAAQATVLTGSSGWSWGFPQPQGNALRALAVDGARVYAAGDHGTLLRSDDGGATWSGRRTGALATLDHIQILAGGELLVGGGCELLRSADGGASFRRLSFSPGRQRCPTPMVAFSFGSPQVGYVVSDDGRVLRTDDGGQTFKRRGTVPSTKLTDRESDLVPLAMAFTGPDTGFVSTSSGALYRTTDGATSFTPAAASPGGGLRAIRFLDASNGFAVGAQAALLRTTDGGATWTRAKLTGAPVSGSLQTIACLNPALCVMPIADGAQLLLTTDGGASARVIEAGARPLLAAAPVSETELVGVGALGAIARSSDGGATFTQLGGRPAGLFTLVRTGAASNAYAAGHGGAFTRTADGGETWLAGSIPSAAAIRDLSFATSSAGLALDAKGALFSTTDSGATWARLGARAASGARAVVSIDERTFLVLGKGGIQRSADGGASALRRVARGAMVGAERAGGRIVAWGRRGLRFSTNRGRSFRALTRPSRATIDALDMVNDSVGFALDGGGRLWRTTSGGRRWRELLGLGTNAVRRIAFSDALHGYVTLDELGELGERSGGHLLRTSDGGKTFRPQRLDKNAIVSIAAGNGSDYALTDNAARKDQPAIFVTRTGGDTGRPSRIVLSTPKRRLPRAATVRVSGKVSGAVGGEEVFVMVRETGTGLWGQWIVKAKADGTFKLGVAVDTQTWVIARWLGNEHADGGASAILEIKAKPARTRGGFIILPA